MVEPRITVLHFTDPACPCAFSAEPVRMRLRWHYGEQLHWEPILVNLTSGDPREARRLAGGAPTLQRLYGMPIAPEPRERPASSEPASRLIIGARLYEPHLEEQLLRRIRVRAQAGGLLDDPAVLAAALGDVGVPTSTGTSWLGDPAVVAGLAADMAAARTPAPDVVAAFSHRLSRAGSGLRYSTPSYELRNALRFSIPGFNPVEAYEIALGNLDPSLERHPEPESPHEVLEWAREPLATSELALICRRDRDELRAELAETAHAVRAGADFYWTLEPPAEVTPPERDTHFAAAVTDSVTF